MYVFRFPFVFWLLVACRMSDWDRAERLDGRRKTEEVVEPGVEFRIRIDSGPYCSSETGSEVY